MVASMLADVGFALEGAVTSLEHAAKIETVRMASARRVYFM
jgi:hypothetical protein